MGISPRQLKKKIAVWVAISGLAASGAAQADSITGIVDTWNVDVSTVFDTTTVQPNSVTVVNPQSLRWGTDIGFGQSGLDISNSPSNQNVNTNGAAVPNVSITHLNRPITAPSLSSLNILSTLTLTPSVPAAPGLAPQSLTFTVHFLETTNTPPSGDPCADGGTFGVGVNVDGCADIYTTDVNALNFPFFYDLDGVGPLQDQQYFISFFESTNGLNSLSAAACASVGVPFPCLGFETPEMQDTTFQFAALITTERVSVPEPGTLALLGVAFAGMGWARRRTLN